MQTDKLIVFDASIFIYANFFVMSSYLGREPTSKELAAKIQQQIGSITSDVFGISTTVLVFDSKNNFRKTIYSGYKASRIARNIDKEFIYEYLSVYFNTLRLDGLEADDIAYLVTRHSKHNLVLVSEDADWELMINEKSVIYRYKQKVLKALSPFEVIIEQVMKVAGGCAGDEVPSIKLKRFGKKTLLKAVEKHNLYEYGLHAFLYMLQDAKWISDYRRNVNLVVYNEDLMREHVGSDKIDLLIEEIKYYD